MANPHRGETALEHDGKTLTLRFSTNVLCGFESVSGCSIDEAVLEIERKKVKLTTLRALLWAGLSEAHPDLTLYGAGDIIDAKGIAGILRPITDALLKAFPQAEKKKARPR